MSRGVKDEYTYSVENNHMRRTSQIASGEESTFRGVVDNNNSQAMASNFARKDEQSSQTRLNSGAAATSYSRDRVNTGRVENLRSMGNDLMRPASQEGGTNMALMTNHHNGPALESAQAKMHNSSSGFYQPSSKYTRLNDYDKTNNDEYQYNN